MGRNLVPVCSFAEASISPFSGANLSLTPASTETAWRFAIDTGHWSVRPVELFYAVRRNVIEGPAGNAVDRCPIQTEYLFIVFAIIIIRGQRRSLQLVYISSACSYSVRVTNVSY